MKNNRDVLKGYLIIGIVLVMMLAVGSYVHTGNFVSGVETIVEVNVDEPLKDKLNKKLDGLVEDTGIYNHIDKG